MVKSRGPGGATWAPFRGGLGCCIRKKQIFRKKQNVKILRKIAPGGCFRILSWRCPIWLKLHQQEDLGERSPKTQTRASREARRQGKIHFLKWIAGAAPRNPLPLPSLSSFIPSSPSGSFQPHLQEPTAPTAGCESPTTEVFSFFATICSFRIICSFLIDLPSTEATPRAFTQGWCPIYSIYRQVFLKKEQIRITTILYGFLICSFFRNT